MVHCHAPFTPTDTPGVTTTDWAGTFLLAGGVCQQYDLLLLGELFGADAPRHLRLYAAGFWLRSASARGDISWVGSLLQVDSARWRMSLAGRGVKLLYRGIVTRRLVPRSMHCTGCAPRYWR